MKRPVHRLMALAAGAVLLVAACGDSAPTSDHILRIALGSPGAEQVRAWDGVAAQFRAAHPETVVEIAYLDAGLYGTTGLQGVLAGTNPPDVYLEWAGTRLAQRAGAGLAADLTAAVRSGPLAGLFGDATLSQYQVGGRIVMVPYSSGVSSVLWYSRGILADAGLRPPGTWDELLAACDTLAARGIMPIATGNRDPGAAGNWLAHLVSRVVGEESYVTVLGGTGRFSAPEWEQAFGRVRELADHGCVNADAGTIDDGGAAQLFLRGTAAMHPGDASLVGLAAAEAPTLDYDFVNLPSPVGGAGIQGSVMGVASGFIVNAKSTKATEATLFLALLNSDANVAALAAAGMTPLAASATAGRDIDNRTVRLTTLLDQAPAIVLPPGTGFDPTTSDAFSAALAAVLDGRSTPAEALAGLDATLGRQ